MTEPPIPRLMLPIGRELGPAYGDGSADPVYRVGIGNEIRSLNKVEHTVWTLAHGEQDFVGDWTRAELERASAEADIRDSEGIIDTLCAAQLIREVQLASDQVMDFALMYRPVPLALGLGQVATDVDANAVGLGDRILGFADDVLYAVFTWAPMFDNLWSNCESFVQKANRGDYEVRLEWSSARLIAEGTLLGAHDLLSVQGVCFDLDPTLPGGAYEPRQRAA